MGAITSLLVDAHVHVHDCFDERVLFDYALVNLQAAAGGRSDGWLGCLLLTETTGQDVFARLKGQRAAHAGDWRFQATAEDCSLITHRDEDERLVLVAGRQVLSAEQIEVLALGTTTPVPDGHTLIETLAAVRAAEALPVLPWGFGKWLGTRGGLVANQIGAARPGELFLGDNGGRLAGSARPRLFARAEARGLAVLPGSDPLPLAQEVTKVGRYGFRLEVPFDPAAPFAVIRQALIALSCSPLPFGRLERWTAFAHRQIAMQVAKRRRARR